MNKLIKFIISPILLAVLLVILCVALGAATFIENDFGAEVAKLKVYNSRWLEAIFLLLSLNLIARVVHLKLYRRKKLSVFLFHIAFVVMVIGAATTRYVGYEGSMHIREGHSSSTLVTDQQVVSLFIDDLKAATFEFPAHQDKNISFKKEIILDDKAYTLELINSSLSAYKKAQAVTKGNAIVGLVISGKNYRGFEYIKSNQMKILGDITVAFMENSRADLAVIQKDDSLFISSPHPIHVNGMGGTLAQTFHNEKVFLTFNKLYKINDYNFVLQEFLPSAKIIAVPTEMKGHKRSMKALTFSISNKQTSEDLTLWEEEWNVKHSNVILDGHAFGLFYGNEQIELPFSLHLDDFEIERYPGSQSPSSFASYVTLHEAGQTPVPFRIYMNNILNHRGFRFYQSSYDQDEKGTILSVNSDRWGTGITYFGYFLMILGILLSMLNSNSFFRKTSLLDKKLLIIVGFIGFSNIVLQAQSDSYFSSKPVSSAHAEAFGELLIQNSKGRTEPIYTFASELMRKISRKEKIFGLSSVQVFMSLHMNPKAWQKAPIIKISNKDLRHQLGIKSKYAAYSDFMSEQKGYKLQAKVQQAYAKPPGQRSKYDKAVLKADEKVNICYGIFSGKYLKILPIPNSTDSSMWYISTEAKNFATNSEDSLFLANIVPLYFKEVNKAKETNEYALADEYLAGLKLFQRNTAGYELPSSLKTSIEIVYYKYNPFKKLFPFYAAFGVIFLFMLIYFIVRGKDSPKSVRRSFYYIILLAFVIHTLAIVARWYISGHAPMSNGYESMIFISWVTLLAGFIYNKQSSFVLPATATLAGLTLMVANLSFMDPEITNLVPVLQSYWLTIHVSVITASYGFLALAMLLGLINMLLLIFRTKQNQERILATLEALTIINHKTIILGLYLLTIGTFLGAIWANESWGRYWGWDPKETWALISILVYTIVSHARLIPGLKGIFTFNVLAIYGFASILMTYFGVNYYLSGLHSYAAGDPVPVPTFVYYTIAAILALTLGASIQTNKMKVKK